jgi:O-antigen/teichoic acid export membrane protein
MRMVRVLAQWPTLQVTVLIGFAGIGFSLGNILLARVLSTHSYAVVALALSLIHLGFPLAPLGLEKVLVRKALPFSVPLVWSVLLIGIADGSVVAIGGWVVYGISPIILALVLIAIVSGGVAYLSSAKFQSLERFPVSVLLAHGPNYFVLLAALVTIALDVENIILPIAIMTAGHVMAGIWGCWKLLAGNKEKYRRINFHWADALSLTGAGAALLVMMQLERLVIPKVLELEALATFGLLAAIALAPFRLLQMGVARTLLPRLGNAESIEIRRKLVQKEALIVCGTLVATSVAVWVVTPFVVRWFLSGRYEFSPLLVLAVIVAGLVRVLNGFTSAIMTALATTRELVSWTVVSWLLVFVTGAGAVIGAQWGLTGVIYGASLGWLVRFAVAFVIIIPHLRPSATVVATQLS